MFEQVNELEMILWGLARDCSTFLHIGVTHFVEDEERFASSSHRLLAHLQLLLTRLAGYEAAAAAAAAAAATTTE